MNRKRTILILFIISILLFTSCGGNKTADMESSKDIYTEEYDEEPMKNETENISNTVAYEPHDKFIITMNLDIETTDFENFSLDMEKIISQNNGYIENSSISHNNSYGNYKNAHYTLRIPKESMDNFKNSLIEKGNLTNENTNREDVSSQYKDTESRLKLIETKEKRILKLLESANIMTDIIELEKELNNTIYEKESLTSILLNLDDKIDYSTIYVYVSEVERYSNVDNKDNGLSIRISNAFKNSFHFFIKSLENILIFFIYAIPFIIVLVIFFLVIRKIFRSFRNKKNHQ